MSFNPVSDWVPESDKRPSPVSTYTKEEVSKGKRIGELAARDIISRYFSSGTNKKQSR